ncbi:RNA 2',3'-cyclic phosphodiesterase [Brevibacillus sp. H7]|jgi:2'-5' RNA ligase|uniref:RNA 2',3'-cyclic phosphodiesterase n=1 Tax=Brevibacillus sp. H7 TaxID=3349138 RepID=UPI0037FC326A
MRLFVALDIPDDAVEYLGSIQRALRQLVRADRWQPLHNLHLTLHFLGEVEEAFLPRLQEDLDIVSTIIEPFTLELGHFGAFPHPQKPRVLWLGLRGQIKALQQLHMLLGKRFDLHPGLSYDKREYRPHITLARGPHAGEDGLPLYEWNERFLIEQPPQWRVGRVHLYRSELQPKGAIHTVIHTGVFGKGGKE